MATPMRESTPFTAYKLSRLQEKVRKANEEGKYGRPPKNCVVTGGTGFVGQRLVEMLVERGAERVVVFDIVPPAANMLQDKVKYIVGDLCDAAAVEEAIKGADCVWHNGAAVGPYHPMDLYERVNVGGTRNVLDACLKHGVKKLVFSSSPSTRFDGRDFDGQTADEMPSLPQKRYVQEYAKTKAEAELLVRNACCDDLLTISVAPHQVYGPRDNLFMPNFLEVASNGKLRIFGDGNNRICFTHVDNYAHALILGEKKLFPGSPALGKFYIATDGDTHTHKEGYTEFWLEMDAALVSLGFRSLHTKFHLPVWFMMCLGFICEIVGSVIGTKLKLSRFTVKMLTMHRWFNIEPTIKDLDYQPVIGYGEGWPETVEWFRVNWLPTHGKKGGGFAAGIAKQSQAKIDIQAESVSNIKQQQREGDKKTD